MKSYTFQVAQFDGPPMVVYEIRWEMVVFWTALLANGYKMVGADIPLIWNVSEQKTDGPLLGIFGKWVAGWWYGKANNSYSAISQRWHKHFVLLWLLLVAFEIEFPTEFNVALRPYSELITVQ